MLDLAPVCLRDFQRIDSRIIDQHLNYQKLLDKMAEGSGIDRKADEKIQFSTSKEVTVHPTFESMSLKGRSMSLLSLVPAVDGRGFRQRMLVRAYSCRMQS